MKKTKTKKGITLIGLIITILILVILAAVAITAIQKGQIIEYAASASKEHNTKKTEEETFIESYYSSIIKDENNNNNNSNNDNNSSTAYFTIKETNSGTTTTYNFVEGQTWNEYIQNNDKFNLYAGNNIYYEHSTEVAYVIKLNGAAVGLNDPIVNGGLYTYEHVDGEWGPLIPMEPIK